MLKRFYSKRSGFTLVEIVIAFAVFAIMASMVAQILQLSVNARRSNNEYALQLAQQEKVLAVIEKDSKYFEATDGSYNIKFTDGDTEINLPYQVKAADPSLADQGEGLNYFLSNVDYTAVPGAAAQTDSGSGMSQASRMDTRITGTVGIAKIVFKEVYKDPFTYSGDLAVPAGCTRYWFEVAAYSSDEAGNRTLREEDVDYAQYRLFFYHDELDAAESSKTWTDKDKKEYTKDVYKQAEIVRVGHINQSLDYARNQGGLTASIVSDGTHASVWNPYLVQSMQSNSVRIGTPFGSDSTYGGKILSGANSTRFFVDFKGDPHLTAKSFGYNAEESGTNVIYRVFPQYKNEVKSDFKDDGTPKYTKITGKVNPCIYGAYLYTRHYK